uniref:Secreted protein n=1 Tax=Streptomyces sp. NBC_00003 TaxID=2903608 RepID=A0AAU2V802_9ACTN
MTAAAVTVNGAEAVSSFPGVVRPPKTASDSPWQVTVTLCRPAAAPAGTVKEVLSVQSAVDAVPDPTAVPSHRTRAAAPHWNAVPKTFTVLPGAPDPGLSETAGGGGGGSGARTWKVPLRCTDGREAQVAVTVCVPGTAFAGTTYPYLKAPDASVRTVTGGKRSLVRVSGPANPSPFPAQSKPLPFTGSGPP